ncbi:PD40 domain-containing protein [bacterium]|nr:PD40 domain-containing protein [bacterium]
MRNHLILLALAAMLGVGPSGAWGRAPQFIRHPSLSPDGAEIAFVYEGDVWKAPRRGGRATRLTSHAAYDVQPRFSPDGKWIAFASNRTGLYDTYVMPAGGGPARRLTWYDSHYDTPNAWMPDSKHLLITTFRATSSDVYLISLEGETPVRVGYEPWEAEYAAAPSPDGKWVAFCRRAGAGAYFRWGYHGTDNADIYLADYGVPWTNIRRLTTHDGHDLWPQWSPDGRTLYFCSNRDGAPNVHRMKLAPDGTPEGEPEALTQFTDGGLHGLDVSADGRWIAFARDFQLYVMRAAGGKLEKVDIQVYTDAPRDRVTFNTLRSGVTEYALSPDGKKLAMVVEGDIFIKTADEKTFTRQVTSTPWRECQPAWAPDSRRLVYASMRHGNRDLFIYDAATGKEELLWEKTPENEAHPAFSPDGAWIAYFVSDTTIVIRSETGEVAWRRVNPDFSRALTERAPYVWSADSRWLLFEQNEPRDCRSFGVFNLESGEVHTLSRVGRYAGGAAWSSDGRLVFALQEADDMDIYALDPVPATPDFPLRDFEQLFGASRPEPAARERRAATQARSASGPQLIHFDFHDVARRARQLTPTGSDEWNPAISPDGDTAFFTSTMTGQSQIYSRSTEGMAPEAPRRRRFGGAAAPSTDLRQRNSSSGFKGALSVSPDGKYLYYLNYSDNLVHRLELASDRDLAMNFEVDVRVDEAALWREALVESGWLLDHYYYDPQHHGVDWTSVVRRYQRLLPDLVTREDFGVMLDMMFGELRSSHLSVSWGDEWRQGEQPAGMTGIILDPRELLQGRFVVESVEPHSAATRPEADLSPGERILAVDGEVLEATSNWDRLLSGKVGKEVRLQVAAPDGATRTAYLLPTAWRSFWDLQYENWVEDRRRRTHELSGGRLGYLHIREMDRACLERFKRDLRDQGSRYEGVVIDIRRNYGGNTAMEMVEILNNRAWAYTERRGQPRVSEPWRRGHALDVPSVMLVNHQSVSNAEMMSEGYRALGLGKVVGIPTEGGVIFTSSYRLLNGFTIRRPFEGIYTAAGENFEGKGREPDIYVDVDPNDYQSGRDPQLERAVKELLAQLDAQTLQVDKPQSPPVPIRPTEDPEVREDKPASRAR